MTRGDDLSKTGHSTVGSLDYSRFLLAETLPTKRNQQEKHRRQQPQNLDAARVPSCPQEKTYIRALCASSSSHLFQNTCKTALLCCGSCCLEDVLFILLDILKECLWCGKKQLLPINVSWMEIRQLKAREGGPSKATDFGSTQRL